jgi:tight adherence protein C
MEFINYISGFVGGLIKDPATAHMAFVTLMAVATFTFFLAIMFLVSWVFRPVKGRLRSLDKGQASAGTGGQSMSRMLESSAGVFLPQGGATRLRFQTMLIHAGYRKPNAILGFYGIKLMIAILLPLAVLFITGVMLKLSATTVSLFTVAAVITAVVMPALVLERQVRRRQTRLRRGLPDALDLLVVCTEAGLGLKAGLQRVSDDIYVSHPELADELALVNAQTRVGVENVVALKDLADRTGLEDIRGLVSTLSQSMKFGTSLAETLRVYSEEMRDKRIQRAEEQAAKLSTKMLFPLIFCVFPSFFVVALGPPFLGALDALRGVGFK